MYILIILDYFRTLWERRPGVLNNAIQM